MLVFGSKVKTTERIAAATRQLDHSRPEDLAEDAAISQRVFSQSFDAKWSRAAGYSFSYSLFDLADYMRNLSDHRNGAEDKPRDGFMCNYGRVSIWEDVATSAEAAHTSPKGYARLTDKNDLHPDQKRFARVYRAKLDLLLEYGFITQKTYRDIMEYRSKPTDPAMAAFCANLNCP